MHICAFFSVERALMGVFGCWMLDVFECRWCEVQVFDDIMRIVSRWAQASEERRAFLARMLELLLDAAFLDVPRLCAALLAVEAAPVGSPDRGGPPPGQTPVWERAAAAAQRLLAGRRESLALWGAYAALQARAGQVKVRYP